MEIDSVQSLLSYIDLTSLNDDDDEHTIQQLCQNAQTPYGHVAAVCIYPQFVSLAADYLKHTSVTVATVCNFPLGDREPSDVYKEIEQAINSGAHEIDMVIPFQSYALGDVQSTQELVSNAKTICGTQAILKVILEVNALLNKNTIYQASLDVIHAGADFIKTSTGKLKPGATLESASIMMSAIQASRIPHVGLKVAGGVREINQAMAYQAIAKEWMGGEWVNSKHFRIGASQLLENIVCTLNENPSK